MGRDVVQVAQLIDPFGLRLQEQFPSEGPGRGLRRRPLDEGDRGRPQSDRARVRVQERLAGVGPPCDGHVGVDNVGRGVRIRGTGPRIGLNDIHAVLVWG